MRTIAEIITEAFKAQAAGNLDHAQYIYDELIGSSRGEPDPNLLFGYGTLVAQRDMPGLATCLFQTLLSIAPKYPGAHANLGLAYRKLGLEELALKHYRIAETDEPWNGYVLSNIAGVLLNSDRSAEAEDYARRAVKLNPEIPAAHMHLGIALLEQGKFEEGWVEYEHRWEVPEKRGDKRPFVSPRWHGEDVGTLAIHGEQGLGDEILYMSYLPALLAAKRAKRIVVECAPRLVPLFARSFNYDRVGQVVSFYPTFDDLIAASGEPDAWIPMGSLPRYVPWPSGAAYLERRGNRMSWAQKRVGLCWRGGKRQTSKSKRTINYKDFARITRCQGFDFTSLQYGDTWVVDEANELGLDQPPDREWDTLVQWTAECDLVISNCQTAVHLAGAMGVPTWVLTPKQCAWRYAGAAMPWYSSVKLFRQDERENWDTVIAQVVNALRHVGA